MEGKQPSEAIPDAVRQHIQGSVKFTELPGLANRMAWQVGETVEELIHLLGCGLSAESRQH